MNYTKGIHTVGDPVRDLGEYNDRVKNIAISACYSINPDNPINVAENIVALYEALQQSLIALNDHPDLHYGVKQIIQKALAKAEGRELKDTELAPK